jgi:predicted deacetylase
MADLRSDLPVNTARRLVVSIHDVAPATLDATIRLRELVRQHAGAIPVSLLIVPCYHGEHTWSAEAVDWVRGAAAAGDELVLHGWQHQSPRRVDGAEFGRHMLFPAVRERIRKAQAHLTEIGIATEGFIAPAYAHPPAVEYAMGELHFSWWATRRHVHCAGGVRPLPSMGLGASTPARRAVSPTAAAVGCRIFATAPNLRLDLHPADLAHPRLRRAIPHLIQHVTRGDRRAVSHAEIVNELRPPQAVVAAPAIPIG